MVGIQNRWRTWSMLETIDDVVNDDEKVAIAEIEHNSSVRCPHLKKLGNSFLYCGLLAPEGTLVELKPENKVIQARQEACSLALYCTDNFQKCIHYQDNSPAK